MTFTVADVNLDMQFLDVHVLNPNNRILAYELDFTGLTISDAVSLADPFDYDITPSFAPGGNKVIGLSYDGASFHKNLEFVPFLRVYWTESESEICLSEVIDVVNDDFQNTLHGVMDGCVSATGLEDASTQIEILPNPMSDFGTVRFPLGSWALVVTDLQGRVVVDRQVQGRTARLNREALKPGTYLLQLSNASSSAVIRFQVR